MKKYEVNMPGTGICSFCKLPIISDNDIKSFDVVVCGIPYDWGVGFRPGARFGPRAIREMSTRFTIDGYGYWDIKKKKRMLSGVQIADLGDVDVLYYEQEYNFKAIKQKIYNIRKSRALPVILGGDHSITYPVLQGYIDESSIGILQLDAHLDFKDHNHGLKYTNSSPIKRVSELNYVSKIASIGIRGTRVSEVDFKDALSNNVHIITAKQVKQNNTSSLINSIDFQKKTYLTIDIDVLDPSVAPGTGSPEPGGLSFLEIKSILEIISQKTEIIGFDLVEVNPQLDTANITSLIACNIIIELLGAIFEN